MKQYKKIFLFLVPCFSLFINISIQSGAEIPMGGKRYETIQIEYSINGKFQSGRESFIQKNGNTLKETYIETKILEKKFFEHTLEIDDGTTFFRINLINKTGMKLPSLNSLKQQMIEKNPHLFNRGKQNPLSITPAHGLLKRTEKVLDKVCKIYLYNNRLLYIWDDIILQETWDILDKSVKKAVKLEINKPVENSVFQIPKDIVFPEKE